MHLMSNDGTSATPPDVPYAYVEFVETVSLKLAALDSELRVLDCAHFTSPLPVMRNPMDRGLLDM